MVQEGVPPVLRDSLRSLTLRHAAPHWTTVANLLRSRVWPCLSKAYE